MYVFLGSCNEIRGVKKNRTKKKKIEELKEEERKKNEKSHTFLQKMNKLRNSKEFIRCEGISTCV